MSKAAHLEIGKKGEEVAQKWLKIRGFSILECNYWKKWGEIDIVAQKDGVTHFIEVKTARCDSFPLPGDDKLRPEENMHAHKIARMARAVNTYLDERNVGGDWTADLCIVWLNTRARKARVQFVRDIVLE